MLQETQWYEAGGSTRASWAPTKAGGTVRTGHGAVRMTRSATLPIKTRLTPRPRRLAIGEARPHSVTRVFLQATQFPNDGAFAEGVAKALQSAAA